MHNIQMAEFTEEFSHRWNAAGSHIQRMAGGDLSILAPLAKRDVAIYTGKLPFNCAQEYGPGIHCGIIRAARS